MKTIKTIETAVSEVELCHVDGNEIIEISDVTLTTNQLQDTLELFVANLKAAINEDLRDVWKRLDELEKLIREKQQ